MDSSASWSHFADEYRGRRHLWFLGAGMVCVVGAASFVAGMQYHRANRPLDIATELFGESRLSSSVRPRFQLPQRVPPPRQHLPLRQPFLSGHYHPLEAPVVSVHAAGGHQDNRELDLSPEDMTQREKFVNHQRNAQRLSNAEEVRTMIEYSNGYGMLSTNSVQYGGFPTGSVVGFAMDDEGYPFMVLSSMSSHTNDVKKDGRISLTVLAKDFKGAAEGRCTLVGTLKMLDDDKKATYREMYMTKHPDAFWIDFGDFTYWKMDELKGLRYIGGFARAGSIKPEDYLAAKPDPVAAYADHVMKHMNDDHSDATSAIVRHYVGVDNEDANIVEMDSLGMVVKATLKLGGEEGEAKVRVPWDEGRVTDRKAIKDVMVRMTKAAAAATQPTTAGE